MIGSLLKTLALCLISGISVSQPHTYIQQSMPVINISREDLTFNSTYGNPQTGLKPMFFDFIVDFDNNTLGTRSYVIYVPLDGNYNDGGFQSNNNNLNWDRSDLFTQWNSAYFGQSSLVSYVNIQNTYSEDNGGTYQTKVSFCIFQRNNLDVPYANVTSIQFNCVKLYLHVHQGTDTFLWKSATSWDANSLYSYVDEDSEYTFHSSYGTLANFGNEFYPSFYLNFGTNNSLTYQFRLRCIYDENYNEIDGYETGYHDGYGDGRTDGENIGYDKGYADGLATTQRGTFFNLFGALADTPLRMLYSLFSFDLFGMSALVIVLSFLTGIFVIKIVKKFL